MPSGAHRASSYPSTEVFNPYRAAIDPDEYDSQYSFDNFEVATRAVRAQTNEPLIGFRSD